MPPSTAGPTPGPHPRRRTVRVVQPRVNWQIVLATFLTTSLAAAILVGSWHLWRTNGPEPVHQRSLGEIELQWKCPAGHRFRAPGRMQPYPCPQCGKPAGIVDTYQCEVHGAFEVWVRLGIHPRSAKPLATHLRLGDEDWVPIAQGLHCPRCGRTLNRVRPDPLDRHRSD